MFMSTLQTGFRQFHDAIKLDDENETLRQKRDILLKKLSEKISKDAASYTNFNQGSYAMNTGIKPEDGDYDIDVGLKFDINKTDYTDPVVVKKWVRDALEGHTKSVKIRRSCVTVQYQEGSEPLYHVDFAVYAAKNDDGKLYVAKGKESSDASNKYWEVSDPQGLIQKILEKHSDNRDAQQFRRIIRYMKKWRCRKFSSSGNEAPTGIALTILAYNLFSPNYTTNPLDFSRSYDDFTALHNLVKSIQGQFSLTYEDDVSGYTISTSLPVEPYNNLFDKLTLKQKTAFRDKIIAMNDKLEEVKNKSSLSDKCTLLQDLFGTDFPILSTRSMVGSSESA
jgi:hypothetical protein